MNESEQWHEGPELTLDVGLTDEEIRATAINAAASAWAGISAIRDRDGSIIETARKFAEYIATGPGGREPDVD